LNNLWQLTKTKKEDRSKDFLVQAFHEKNDLIHVSICHAKYKYAKWVDGIKLQHKKQHRM